MTSQNLGRSDASAARIGALVPLTRPGWVEAGRHLLAGLQLAVDGVNGAGGIAGRPLALVVRDTAADPRKATAAVAELAHLGVAALAGEFHSVVARAAATEAQRRPCDCAVATEPSAYWASGTGILRDHLAPRGGTVTELDLRALGPRRDWHPRAAKFREGEIRIAAALRELESHGYLTRAKERLQSGRVVTRTVSYNKPHRPVVRERRPASPPPRSPTAPPPTSSPGCAHSTPACCSASGTCTAWPRKCRPGWSGACPPRRSNAP